MIGYRYKQNVFIGLQNDEEPAASRPTTFYKPNPPLCPGCYRFVRVYLKYNGLCRECQAIWREWERTRLKAVEAAIAELVLHGFGCHRIAQILSISKAQVRGTFQSKLPYRPRDGKFSRKRQQEPKWYSCSNPECGKSFAVRYSREGSGKYCCQACVNAVKGANLKLIATLAKQGYSKTQIAIKTGISYGHISKNWWRFEKPAEGKTKYASTLTTGDLGNDPPHF